MRNLINIGKAPDVIYVDADLVFIIIPNEQKGFGSLVGTTTGAHPIGTSLDPGEVYARLSGKPSGPKLVS